ncbi:MAG: GNAT family N-acetyltransferase [Lachnospiraceae bacterium]|nr:GNAT family N-acetyltransferase [Lachnospiraceae bacterium]
MANPYEKCPVFENENYLLRLIEPTDTEDLLLVYSDEKAVPFFNSDNCDGDDFHYTTLERMQSAVEFWQQAYAEKWFVRWAIIDKKSNHAIGTIELFNRQADDYFNDCGLLRLDLRSDYEQIEIIHEILSLIIPATYELFDCRMIATKVPPFATERISAVEKLGFVLSEETLIGGNTGKEYNHYYVLQI